SRFPIGVGTRYSILFFLKVFLSKFALKHKYMLQISYIRENKDKVIEALKKRGFKEIGKIEEILDLDGKKRSIQSESDMIASKANAAAKQIGELMKSGKREEANLLKAESSTYKEQVKELTEEYNTVEEKLNSLLVSIPNLPH